MPWKYQQPPRGLTGDSTPYVLPLMTLILVGPSLPSGYAVGILMGRDIFSMSSRDGIVSEVERTRSVLTLDMKGRPFYTAWAGQPKVGDREVQGHQGHVLAFQRG